MLHLLYIHIKMYSMMNIKLGEQLDNARKAAHLRQEDVATQAGVSRLTAQRIFSGEVDPRLSTLSEIARSLGLDVMLVPSSLRLDLENFVRSGGKYLAQPAGISAPHSIVDRVAAPPRNLPAGAVDANPLPGRNGSTGAGIGARRKDKKAQR
jgi:transcriptional regulator with XRE-family HTH domain